MVYDPAAARAIAFGPVESTTSDLNEPGGFYYGQRGILGDTASLLGRAGIATLETIENAAEFFNLNDSKVDSASKLRNFDLFKPDLDEYMNRGLLQETMLGSIPGAFESMGPSLTVAGTGALTGAGISTALGLTPIPGGIIGGVLASLGIMGTSEYQQTYEAGVANGMTEEDASSLAWKTGAIEGLGESVGTLVGASPLMKPLTNIAKQGLKETLKGMTKANVKSMAKELATVYAGEQATEFGQAIGQTALMREAGLTDVSNIEAALQTVIPTMFMTGAFQVGTNTLQANKRAKLKEALSPDSPVEVRQAAVDAVHKMIQPQDSELAGQWKVFADEHIKRGEAIDFNADFEKFAQELEEAHAKPITPEGILGKTVTKEDVNAALNKRLIDSIYDDFIKKPAEPTEERRVEAAKTLEPVLQREERREAITEAFESKEETITKRIDPLIKARNEAIEAGQKGRVRTLNAEIRKLRKEAGVIPEITPVEPVEPTPTPEDIVAGSNARTTEEAQAIANAIQGKIKEAEKKGDTDTVETLTAYKNAYNALADTLPKQSELEEEPPTKTELQEIMTQGIETIEADIAQLGGFKVTGETAGALPESKRAVDMRTPTPLVGWAQAEEGFTGARTSNELVGTPKGTEGITYRALKDGNKWAVFMEPENESPILLKILEGKEARKNAAKFVEEHAAGMGTKEWRRSKSPDGRPVWTITRDNVTYQITNHAKNVHTVEYLTEGQAPGEGELLINPSLKGKRTTRWDMSIGRTKKAVEDLAGFETLDTEKEIRTKRMRGDAEERSRRHRPEKLSAIDRYFIYEPTSDITAEDIFTRKLRGKKRGLIAERYQAKEMTPELRDEIEKEIERLTNELTTEDILEAGVATAKAEKGRKTEVGVRLEGEILSLQRILETPDGTVVPGTPLKAKKPVVPAPVTSKKKAARVRRVTKEVTKTKAELEKAEGGVTVPGPTKPIAGKLVRKAQAPKEKPGEEAKAVKRRFEERKKVLPKEIKKAKKKVKEVKKEVKKIKAKEIREATKELEAKIPRTLEVPKITEAYTNLYTRWLYYTGAVKGLTEYDAALRKEAESLGKVVGTPEETLEADRESAAIQDATGIVENLTVNASQTIKMTSRQFLGLTTRGRTTINRIKAEGFIEKWDGSEYEEDDKAAFEYDESIAKSSPNSYLIIDENGQIVGHEGRHRAVFGPNTMNVTLLFKGKVRKPSSLAPQFTEGSNLIEDPEIIVPLNNKPIGTVDRRRILKELQRESTAKKRIKKAPDVSETGVPTETNALELLTKNRNPLVNAVLRVIPTDALKNIPVVYDPGVTRSYFDGDRIVLAGDSKEVKVHEAIHAAISNKLNTNKDLKKELEDIFKKFSDSATPGTPSIDYALQNLDEFLSQAISDPATQEVLRGIPSKIKGKIGTIWDKFINWSRSILGLSQTYNNLLGETLDVIGKISQEESDGRIDDILYAMEETLDPKAKKKNIFIEDQAAKEKRQATMSAFNSGSIWEDQKKLASRFFEETGRWFKGAFEVTSESLRKLSPKYMHFLRKFEFSSMRNSLRHLRSVTPFIKGIQGIKDQKIKNDLWYFLTNSAVELEDGTTYGDEAMKIIKSEGLLEEFNKVKSVIEEIEGRAVKVGFIISKINNYFPRHVKDYKGLMKFLEDRGKIDPEGFGKFLRNTRAKVKATSKDISPEEEQAMVVEIITRGNYPGIPLPGSTKLRSIYYVPSEAMQFYSSLEDSLINHIYEMNDKVGARKIIGAQVMPRAKAAKSARKVSKIIEKLQKRMDNAKLPTTKAVLAKKIAKETETLSKLNATIEQLGSEQVDLEESVSSWLRKDTTLNEDQQASVARYFNSRFKQRGTHGAMQTLKNLGLVSTLGNPLSAITQIGDQAYTLYKYGNIFKGDTSAFKGMMKALSTQEITKEFDFDPQLREFSMGQSTKVLTSILKWSGLKTMDLFGKESFLQAAKSKYSKMSLEEFKGQWGEDGDLLVNVEQTWESFKSGDINEEALYVLYSDLSDFQPISLSETPEFYQTSGNARILWMLKTFAVKAVNNVVRESVGTWKQGNKQKAVVQFVSLVSLLSLAGAASDEIKDVILGREKRLQDHVTDNLLQLMLVSRYDLDKGFKQGSVIKNITAGWLPPVRYIDDSISDIYNLLRGEPTAKSLRAVPLGGRVIYDRMTSGGRVSEFRRQRTDILEDIADGNINSRRIAEFNRDSREYRDDIPAIDKRSIKAAREKE
jgi:hypothetical protein